MKNHKLIQAQHAYVGELTKNCTHGLTLQTNLYTCNSSQNGIGAKVIAAKQAMRCFIPKLNRLLSGNGYRRNPALVPVIITALEGSLNTYDRNKTLHFHMALGNFDEKRLSPDTLEKIIEQWIGTGIGTDDVKLHTLRPTKGDGWGGYIYKEAWKGNSDCIDLDNTQLPVHLLAD